MSPQHNTLSIVVSAKDVGASETVVLVNGRRLGSVVIAQMVEPTCRGLSAMPVFEAFGLDDVSRGEFPNRTAAAVALMEL